MRVDTVSIKPIYSSFFSHSKDAEEIVKLLFVKSRPYSDKLKRLLIINNPDCLDENNEDYQRLIDNKTLSMLRNEGYVRMNPKIARKQFEEIKAYILITFDNFSPNRIDPKFMDCTVNFDIICYDDEWDLDGFQVRPLMIAGYIDGILNTISNENKYAWNNNNGNNVKLSGMGEYAFLGCNLVILNQDISMYTLSYRALHFTEDKLKEGQLVE